jgi:hypothetical protein
MAFNFKKNLLIIMLLVIVLLSTIVYVNIQNIKESFIANRIDSINIIPETYDTSYNYYRLNTSANHYIIKNFSMTPPHVNSYLSFVKTVSGDEFSTGTSNHSIVKTYFANNKALLGYYSDNNNVALYTIVLPNIILDISSIRKSSTLFTNTIHLLLIENGGNLYDLSNTKLTTSIKINGVDIIKSGVFQQTTATPTAPAAATPTAAPTTAVATMGDINFTGLFGGAGGFGGGLGTNNSIMGISNELFLYLLNRGAFGSSYVPPIYNNFETAMNLSSNPIVNPVNSMNPLEYAQTLFGPEVTPMMSKNSSLNSDTKIAAAKANADTTSDTSRGKKSNTSSKDMFKFDTDGNLLSQNIGANNDTRNTSNYSKSNNDDKSSNSKCAPCPAPQRCPESNFECKKVPNYEQGLNNAFLPRPVLADFSTFGM